jgi:glyoxylase-like metal-dependent hydrolase (beta-lactamase superfamily II)
MKTDVDYIYGETLPEPGTAMEVAPGIRWIRMPLPFALDHVNLFLLDDGPDGWVLVDTGAALKPTQDLWELVLANELQGKPISQIIVTHFHPDHVGNAGWLQDRTGAPLWMSRSEWLSARVNRAEPPEQFQTYAPDFYSRAGLSDLLVGELRDLGNHFHSLVSPVPPIYRRISEETALEIGGRTWVPILSGGHSPEHICLYCPDDNLVLGGDFLLPRISPNVSVWWNEPDGNPLADYIRFLQNLDYMEDDILVLPSHDRPYRGLHERRADLIAHHHERFDLALEVCAEPSTAADVMYKMFKRQLDAHQSRFAIGEALAHLNYLVEDGQLDRSLDDDGVWRYRAEV